MDTNKDWVDTMSKNDPLDILEKGEHHDTKQ